MIKNQSKVMVNPSLFVAERTSSATFTLVREFYNKGFEFYLPKNFHSVVMKSDKQTMKSYADFFLRGATLVDLFQLRDKLESFSKYVLPFTVEIGMDQYTWLERYLQRDSALRRRPEGELIMNTIFEEWVFLQEQSWIVSRVKVTFDKFIDAGAACLRFGKVSAEKMIRKTLKKKTAEIIRNVDILRAIGKWLAVGGPAIMTIFNPIVGVFSSIVSGYFLLIDPPKP